MTKYSLNSINGAVCLDNSSGIYYFKAGSKENSTKWTFHLNGGGLCMSDAECLNRSYNKHGTSTLWPDEYELGGPLSEDPNYNPDFADWNHVFFPYCDGASFSGDKDEPIDVDGHKIYYRGHRILVEIIKDLLANKGLDKATHVLLVGDSAGGMASYFHADEIGSMLPKNTIFKVAPFSGIFLDLPNVEGQIFWRDLMKSAFERQNCSKSVNDKCVKAQAAGEEYKCFLGQYAMEYIETPLFVINSRSDLIGILCIVFGAPLIGTTSEGAGNCTAIPGSLECFLTLQCTHEQFEDMEWYASNFSHIIENKTILHKNGNGLYEYSCYSHADEPASYWSNLVVQNVTLRDAVSKWFFSTNESASKHTYKDCVTHDSFFCNPTCIPPTPPPSNSSSTSSSTSSPSTSSSHSSPSTSSVTPTSSSTTPTPSSTTPTPSTSSSSGMVLYPMVTLISAAFIVLSYVF